ncbi:MAG: outer membrane beta-barrel protein [Paludibacteraceae bacterium]|nr:outer membrane beta-barrel protein [Paludibacteraceae bacterium]
MAKKQLGLMLLLALVCVPFLRADDKPLPAYQIADNTFFDPSKKEEKKEPYIFGVEYRIEAGYVQHWQRAHDISFPDMYLHGIRLGATFTFKLPLRFGLQTGLLYTLVYGQNEQHWRSQDVPSVQTEYITHRVLEHNLTVPIRAYYTIPLWKQLNLFFFTGPQLHIGLAENDYMDRHLSEPTKAWLESQAIPTAPYDRMADEIVRANIQWGVGGGFEWDQYRLQAGYDFGLNNLVRHPQLTSQYMSEWAWFVSFSYRF